MNYSINAISYTSLAVSSTIGFVSEIYTDLGVSTKNKKIANLASRTLQNISASLVLTKGGYWFNPTAGRIATVFSLIIAAAPLTNYFMQQSSLSDKVKTRAFIIDFIDLSTEGIAKIVNMFNFHIAVFNVFQLSNETRKLWHPIVWVLSFPLMTVVWEISHSEKKESDRPIQLKEFSQKYINDLISMLWRL